MSLKKIIYKLAPSCVKKLMEVMINNRHDRNIFKRNLERINTLLKSKKPIKLEIGAGPERKLQGWTTADLCDGCDIVLDLTKPLPFPDKSVDMIYSSHVLEHFKFTELMQLLGECYRVLKPGGIFSASVPNARIYIEAYANPEMFDPDVFCRHKPAYNFNSKIDYINYMAYMDGHHRHMFDEENILAIIGKTGFQHPRLRAFDETIDMKERDFQSIYVQAEK